VSTRTRAGSRPATGPLLLRQVRHQNRLFLRNPFSAFFSLALPLMFLLVFGSLNSGQTLEARGGIPYVQFLTPGLLAFAVVSTCYTGLVTGVAMNRDMGILKRVRGTPLPAWIYVLMVGVGVVLFDVEIIWRMLPAAVGTLLLGSACFCALGMAVAALVPNGEAAPIVANFTVLPVAFISDLFFPMDAAPTWLQTLGSVFPVKHFALALEATFNPFTTGSGWQWDHLAVLALWGVAGLLVAIRKFRWEPNTPGGRRRRR
jgi:ABC-2 type transport system permease protein